VIGSARYVYRVSREASPLRRNIELITDVGRRSAYICCPTISAGVHRHRALCRCRLPNAIGMPPAGANGQNGE